MIVNNVYEIQDSTEKFLTENKFVLAPRLGDKYHKYYRYSFPVLMHGRNILLSCQLLVEEGKPVVQIEVLNSHTRSIYAPFYNNKFGEEDIVKQIESNILAKFRKLGIVRSAENGLEEKVKLVVEEGAKN